MTTTRRALLVAPLALPAIAARAQDAAWPTRPLTMLVPFVAGGPSDIVARLIAARLGPLLGQPVVAENRTGANGAIAAQALARAAPDGHTLLTGSIGVFSINPALRPNLAYDPVRDFAPLTLAVTTPNVLVVNPASVPVNDFAGFVAWLKANPTRGAYSTSGVGSSEHLTMELLKLRTGTEAQHVPYQGGAAAATAVLAGDVPFTIQNLGTVAQQIAGGTLRPLMMTGGSRAPTIPQVPTAAECGLADFVVTSWQAVMTQAAVPAPVLARLEAGCIEALRHPESVARLGQIGLTVVAGTAAELRAFQIAEIARWREVVRVANIRAE